jgi:hypothetical protein
MSDGVILQHLTGSDAEIRALDPPLAVSRIKRRPSIREAASGNPAYSAQDTHCSAPLPNTVIFRE